MPYKDPDQHRRYCRLWAQKKRLAKKMKLLRLANKFECEICGESRIWCLEFHHMDPEAKEFAIGKAPANISRAKLMKEIKRCKLVCRNCHADLHNRWELDNGL